MVFPKPSHISIKFPNEYKIDAHVCLPGEIAKRFQELGAELDLEDLYNIVLEGVIGLGPDPVELRRVLVVVTSVGDYLERKTVEVEPGAWSLNHIHTMYSNMHTNVCEVSLTIMFFEWPKKQD